MSSQPPTSPMAKSLLRGRKQKPGKLALLGSFLLHGSLIAFALLVTRIAAREPEVARYQTFKVAIFSPPPQVEGQPEPPKAAPKIIKQPKAPEPPAAKAPAKKAVPTPSTAKPETAKKPTAGRNPQANSPGGEGLNVLMEGEEFPFQGYLENVVRYVNQYFRPVGEGNLETEVSFFIRRDGTASRIKVYRKSGNTLFDIQAVSAVEEVGKRRLFGLLPKEFPRDSLGILFKFVPVK